MCSILRQATDLQLRRVGWLWTDLAGRAAPLTSLTVTPSHLAESASAQRKAKSDALSGLLQFLGLPLIAKLGLGCLHPVAGEPHLLEELRDPDPPGAHAPGYRPAHDEGERNAARLKGR